MKKFLSSIILIMTVMLLCCGCGGKTADSDTIAEEPNYCAEVAQRKNIPVRNGVVSMEDINPSEIDKSGSFVVKDIVLKNDTTLLVTYQFYNNASYARSLYGLLDCGSVSAYQQGVEISSSTIGDIDAFTEVMSGATVEIKKQYTLRSSTDPVTLETCSTHLFWGGETFVHKQVEFGTVIDEEYVGSSLYKNKITGTELPKDGTIKVNYSFTNNSDDPVTPANAVAVHAIQGDTTLNIIQESKNDEDRYIKCYYVEKGQKADLSTTFQLDNNEEEVTVYLTVPETAEIFEKIVCKVK